MTGDPLLCGLRPGWHLHHTKIPGQQCDIHAQSATCKMLEPNIPAFSRGVETHCLRRQHLRFHCCLHAHQLSQSHVLATLDSSDKRSYVDTEGAGPLSCTTTQSTVGDSCIESTHCCCCLMSRRFHCCCYLQQNTQGQACKAWREAQPKHDWVTWQSHRSLSVYVLPLLSMPFNKLRMQGTADTLPRKLGNQCVLLLLAWPPWPLLLLLLLLLPADETQNCQALSSPGIAWPSGTECCSAVSLPALTYGDAV